MKAEDTIAERGAEAGDLLGIHNEPDWVLLLLSPVRAAADNEKRRGGPLKALVRTLLSPVRAATETEKGGGGPLKALVRILRTPPSCSDLVGHEGLASEILREKILPRPEFSQPRPCLWLFNKNRMRVIGRLAEPDTDDSSESLPRQPSSHAGPLNSEEWEDSSSRTPGQPGTDKARDIASDKGSALIRLPIREAPEPLTAGPRRRRARPLADLRLADLVNDGEIEPSKRLMNVKVPTSVMEGIARVSEELGVSKTAAVIALLNEGLEAFYSQSADPTYDE